jgi:hypothetical protein
MSNVKVLKLVTGEELVVEIINEAEGLVEFKNPVAAVLQRSQQTGGAALGFMPWMHAADGPFVVETSKIIVIANVAEEVKNGYNQIFGAGIVVPPQQLITG